MMYETMELRAVFYEGLAEAMRKNENICVVDADLAKANATLELRKEFPERAFDVGVAEANMASVAAGLASYGFIPFIGSFTCFASRRICDQIAISISYAKQNVKIVGSDPGVSAELNGGTHMSMEDMGVLRSIPGMVIFEPVDGQQLAQAMPQIIDYNGPVYIRLFRKVPAPVFEDDYRFNLFTADVIRDGSDVSIIASGIMVSEAMKAAEKLALKGIHADILNVHTIKPLDSKTVISSAQKCGCVVTCENHNVVGGLYGAISEALAAEYPCPVEAIGVKDHFGEVGKTDFLMQKYEMTCDDIVKAAEKAIARK